VDLTVFPSITLSSVTQDYHFSSEILSTWYFARQPDPAWLPMYGVLPIIQELCSFRGGTRRSIAVAGCDLRTLYQTSLIGWTVYYVLMFDLFVNAYLSRLLRSMRI
jgi:hypothetical protein